jgi:hypothetical protein
MLDVKVTTGKDWLRIENIGLRISGLVWGYIVEKFDGGAYAGDQYEPTAIQMKYMANNLNQSIPTNHSFILPYEGEVTIPY